MTNDEIEMQGYESNVSGGVNYNYHRNPAGVTCLTEEDTLANRNTIETLLGAYCLMRPGFHDLIDYIANETDFYNAPCSTVFHLNITGGLALHSLLVYEIFDHLCDWYYPSFPAESRVICALLHDLCKANTYVPAIKSRKTGEYYPNGKAKWEDYVGWDFDEQFPFGHGEKSAYLIMKHMLLTDEEALVIRWHMGGFDNSAKSDSRPMSRATEKYPAITLLQAADMIATSQGF